MATSKFRIRQILLKIDARRFPENNQQKCIDCFKPRSDKSEHEFKIRGCNEFYVPNY